MRNESFDVAQSSAGLCRQIERILASRPFANAHRSQRFLRYLVKHRLEAPEDSLKEYAIAIEVFDRDTSYDPAVDATVRVEAGRLRSRLRDYYADEGRDDTLVIEMPKGGYRLTVTPRPVAGETTFPVNAAPSLGAPAITAEPTVKRHRPFVRLGAVCLVILVILT